MMVGEWSRRRILAGFGMVTGGLLAGRTKAMAAVTPSAAEGPFYPTTAMRPDDTDNDLVRIARQVEQAGGTVITLKGRIADKAGSPIAGCRIEIWQCDVNGTYLHPGDRGRIPHDTGFQGFGHDVTDADGRYRFRTIRPGKYPGRAPHIHVKLWKDGRELLTTQFYIKDLEENRDDFLFRRLTREQADLVSMHFFETVNGLETTVDLIV